MALTSGFPIISLIDLVLKHLPELKYVEKVEEILPVYSREIAGNIFDIIQQHIAWNKVVPSPPTPKLLSPTLILIENPVLKDDGLTSTEKKIVSVTIHWHFAL